jgi:NhaA family Na+:H+ antiporter
MSDESILARALPPGPRREFVESRIVGPLQGFLHLQAAGGILVVIAALVALAWANSPWDGRYTALWGTTIVLDVDVIRIEDTLGHLVNDALMVLFFFLVGLEIKRELVHGELSSVRQASLPAMAAAGGMVAPALIFVAFNAADGDAVRGWAIPVATDIAFAVGVLALIGNRVPASVRVFLLALAIVDDLAGILIIALFYTDTIEPGALLLAGAVVAAIVGLQRYGVRSLGVYTVAGIVLWLAVYESGIHATIAGVVLAMLTPTTPLFGPGEFGEHAANLSEDVLAARRRGDHATADHHLRQLGTLSAESTSPLERLERALHPWVSFLIVPVFALANAGVVIDSESIEVALNSAVTAGVALGLVAGKPLGILLFTFLAVKLGIATLPGGMGWRHVTGAGFLGGIGFTVALFITGLAYDAPDLVAEAKMGILAGSILAGAAGFAYLRYLGGAGAGERPVT